MDLLTLLKILVRRWYVVIPTLTLTLVAGNGLTSGIEPEFDASGSMILLVPTAEGSNPLLGSNRGVEITAVAVTRLAGDSRNREAMRDQGLSPSYSVSVDPTGAILLLGATSDSQQSALDTITGLVGVVEQELENLQVSSGVSEDNQIQSKVLDLPAFASKQEATKNRALVAIAALGIAATLSIALAVESLSSGRSRAKQTAP